MKLKFLKDEDYVNYKVPSMYLGFPECNFKCDIENGSSICQNSSLASEPTISIQAIKIVQRYLKNPLTHAVVCGGLEPFDSWDDLYSFICVFRGFSNDPIIIYTGYKEEEIQNKLKGLSKINNIIIKFGRFIPNSLPIYDKILGVKLASNNQYAKYIQECF